MPAGTPPADVEDFLRRPNPAVVATVDKDGELHTAATWYAYQDDGTVLLNMDHTRRRLDHLRQNPRVALTVLDRDSWYSHVSMVGRVVDIREDQGLGDIDRLSQAYVGRAYANRLSQRWTATVRIDMWHGWNSGHATADSPRRGGKVR